MRKKISIMLILLTLLGLAACGGGGGDASSDTTAPTATASTTIRPFSASESIVISFDETMDDAIGSLTLGGTMAGQSSGIWSFDRTTLTISPMGGNWATGQGRTLTIDAQDLAGNAAATINLTLDVYAGTLYFVSSTAADDTGDGLTPATAKRNIYSAISAATGPAAVVVTGGSYPTDASDPLTRIEMNNQVSLYGGYSADFVTRDPNTSVSTITNTSAIESNTYGTISALSGVTNSTAIDGFSIYGPSVVSSGFADAAAVINYGNLVIQNNVIVGGVHSGLGTCTAITSYSQISIQNNTIRNGGSCSNGYLVQISGSSPVDIRYNRISVESSRTNAIAMNYNDGATVINNLISANDTLTTTYGITLFNSTNSIIRNNTIYSNDNITYGIYMSGATNSNAMIQNNLIYTGTGVNSFCIYEDNSAGGNPTAVQNNDLFGCNVKYRDKDSGCGGGMNCTLAQLNALVDMTSGNNVEDDPQLVDLDGADNDINTLLDNDWHFSASSPASVTAGGLNGIDEIWGFYDDFDKVSRPSSGNPWAIGAYEP